MTNPYESPGRSAEQDHADETPRFLVLVFQTAVVAGFCGLVAGLVWLFYNGYAWMVGPSVLLSFMVAAWFAGKSWHERLVLSFTVPFIALGGAAGLFIYFRMFSFSWFQSIFDSKSAGSVGLILFVCVFAISSGLIAGRCIYALVVRCFPVSHKQQ